MHYSPGFVLPGIILAELASQALLNHAPMFKTNKVIAELRDLMP